MKLALVLVATLWAGNALSFEIDIATEDLRLLSDARTVADLQVDVPEALFVDLCMRNGQLVIAESTPLQRRSPRDSFQLPVPSYDKIVRHADGSLHLRFISGSSDGEGQADIVERLLGLEAVRNCQSYFAANEPMVAVASVDDATKLSEFLHGERGR